MASGMELTRIIGFVAGCMTTFAALPDLIAMLKRRSSVNPTMAGIMGTFQILWVIYRPLNRLGEPRHLERNCNLHEPSYGRGVC